jgi:uncharacterized protein (TIGR00725 family)
MISMKAKRYKIAVSGAIETSGIGIHALDEAKTLGKAIGKRGHILMTGSHHGFPLFSAMGAKDAGGETIYFSPASHEKEHTEGYRLDTDYGDVIIYTGFGEIGSNIFLARSADAVVVGFGKPGALHEFDLALRAGKPVGILKGSWNTDEALEKLAHASHKPVVVEDDPDMLIEKLIELMVKQ